MIATFLPENQNQNEVFLQNNAFSFNKPRNVVDMSGTFSKLKKPISKRKFYPLTKQRIISHLMEAVLYISDIYKTYVLYADNLATYHMVENVTLLPIFYNTEKSVYDFLDMNRLAGRLNIKRNIQSLTERMFVNNAITECLLTNKHTVIEKPQWNSTKGKLTYDK